MLILRANRFNYFLSLANKTDLKPELSYSSIMRTLRKDKDERKLKFQKTFKDAFDRALDEQLEEPEKIALLAAVKKIDFKADK